MSIVLVDMDGVFVDWTAAFERDLAKFFPDLVFEELREFSTPTHLPQVHQDAINWVKNRSGFYRDMRPIPGAIEAIKELAKEHEVRFCSSPEVFNGSCESDKKQWLCTYMGVQWANRLILTKDKTLVRGDVLIDDRPDVHGIMTPEWTQVLFSQPYNDHVLDVPRLSEWGQWRTELEGILV